MLKWQNVSFCLSILFSNDYTGMYLNLTRMHSSRMRTGRTLTVFQKLEHPPQNLKQTTPENLEQTPPPPKKFAVDTPPKICSRHPPPPRKFAADTLPPKIWSKHPIPPRKFGADTPPQDQTPPPCEQNHTCL